MVVLQYNTSTAWHNDRVNYRYMGRKDQEEPQFLRRISGEACEVWLSEKASEKRLRKTVGV